MSQRIKYLCDSFTDNYRAFCIHPFSAMHKIITQNLKFVYNFPMPWLLLLDFFFLCFIFTDETRTLQPPEVFPHVRTHRIELRLDTPILSLELIDVDQEHFKC